MDGDDPAGPWPSIEHQHLLHRAISTGERKHGGSGGAVAHQCPLTQLQAGWGVGRREEGEEEACTAV